MKKLSLIIFICSCVFIFGCSASSATYCFDGNWRGTFIENGMQVLVNIEIRTNGATIEGNLSFLSVDGKTLPQNAQTTAPIVRSEFLGNNIKFTVAVTKDRKVNNDSIVFDLMIEGDELKGSAQEMLAGQPSIPIALIRQ